MRNKKIFLALVLMLIGLVNAEIIDSSREDYCYGYDCQSKLYTANLYVKDSESNYRNISDVLSITKNSDDLTFHYNGIKGYANITFETGLIYNDGYYSMYQVKQSYPEIEFNFPEQKQQDYRKYAVNITNIDTILQSGLQNITLTYKSHSGFSLNDLKNKEGRYVIKGLMQFAFSDLVESGYSIKINESEKRIYVGNLSGKYVSNSLYLDPFITLNTTDLNDGHITYEDGAYYETETGANKILIGQTHSGVHYRWSRGYLRYNTTFLDEDDDIHYAEFCIYYKNKFQDFECYIKLENISDFNVLGTEDWNIPSTTINDTFIHITDSYGWYCQGVTDEIVKGNYTAFKLKGSIENITPEDCGFKFWGSDGGGTSPYLTINYTELGLTTTTTTSTTTTLTTTTSTTTIVGTTTTTTIGTTTTTTVTVTTTTVGVTTTLKYDVEIRVLDYDTMVGIVNASVKAYNDTLIWSNITDGSGKALMRLENGSYALVTSHPSYYADTQQLNVSGSTVDTIKLIEKGTHTAVNVIFDDLGFNYLLCVDYITPETCYPSNTTIPMLDKKDYHWIIIPQEYNITIQSVIPLTYSYFWSIAYIGIIFMLIYGFIRAISNRFRR